MRIRIRVFPEVSIVLDLLFILLVHSVDLKIWEIFKHDAIINEVSLFTTPVFDYCGGYNR
jgi:hypothetical protein